MVGMCDAGQKSEGGMCCAAVQCRPSLSQSWWQFVPSQESSQVQRLPLLEYNHAAKTGVSAQLKLYKACLYAMNHEPRLFSMPSLGQQPRKLMLLQYGFQHKNKCTRLFVLPSNADAAAHYAQPRYCLQLWGLTRRLGGGAAGRCL